MKNIGDLVLSVTVCLLLVACRSTRPNATAWDVVITKTTPASIEVDLIGISSIERPAWEGYDLDQYWSPGEMDSRRAHADKLSKNLQTGQPWVVSWSDPQWQKWLDRGATELLILANLPGQFAPGRTDPRRTFLPLDRNHWRTKGNRLEIEVQDTIVRPLTP
jgi:hypothetical protein